MRSIRERFHAQIIVPRGSIWLLAAGCFVAIVGLFLSTIFAQQQARESDERTECRSTIVGYIDALNLAQSSAGWRALIAAVDNDDIPKADADAVRKASRRLDEVRDLRDRVVAICADNPHFDPSTYTSTNGGSP